MPFQVVGPLMLLSPRRPNSSAAGTMRISCSRSQEAPAINLVDGVLICPHNGYGQRPRGEHREPRVRCSVRSDGHRPTLRPAFAPKPDPQSPKDDNRQDADPERYADTPRRDFHSEEDAKQLRKGDQPEKDRSYERRLFLHLSALSSPMASFV